MGTTKLTRKEILAEDPVHGGIVWLFESFQENRAKIGLIAVAVVVVVIGIWGGTQYLNSRETKAQERLGKGMEFFSAAVTPDATNDPYSQGATPTFKSDSAKYQAAAREFASVASGYGYGSAAIAARYYLGLSQLQLGQKQEGLKSLEAVAANSKNRTVGFLAKKAMAENFARSGNYKGAQELLQVMAKDSQCDLPKEELSLQLSRVLAEQGKQAEAIKVLREASDQSPAFGVYKQQLITEMDKLQKAPKASGEARPLQP